MIDFSAEHALLQEQILHAKANKRVLHVRGFGSKDFYHALNAPQDHDLLSTKHLSGVVNYEPTELFIQVACGTPLRQVESLLASEGQCLPFEPPRFKTPEPLAHPSGDASIGGMVACGLSGPSRASVGAVKDFILGAHLINGQGEHLVFGGQVMKNVAGYDVSRVLASSMGTLGVMTQVTLKVLPVSLGDLSIRAHLSAPKAQSLMQRLGQYPLPLHSSSWCPHSIGAKSSECEFTLRLKGARAATQAARQMIESELQVLGCASMVLEQGTALQHWDGVRDQAHVFFHSPHVSNASLWRISLPLKVLKQEAPTFAQSAMVEWFGALNWVWASPGELKPLQQEVHRLGGSMVLWRQAAQGDLERLHEYNTPIDASMLSLHHQLQQAFDPYGVFNTGRAYPTHR